ncbi:hypothetical protein L336_0240 [Candidatus Saccharimonas aalborgensis]|uniref:DUF2202 domain-containing protein n=1 Tax=Candidatus Saccharimonas aalborgensis TaxID=1332188 RepID=R4PM52_9BACT|nr:DUF2202 domain-containing protein [Candidatus Saccharimonas aalborgensis]AGL61949.1 hypothetical protein L336_0240 [Candidatus Saccharimonas aalborgensis]QQS68480.1 MAG: DUF2202 domain-containing protein [Candidatus Saccharibacteria bacterium]
MTQLRITITAIIAIAITILAGVVGYSVAIRYEPSPTNKIQTNMVANNSNAFDSTIEQGSATKDTTESLLLYLIEEEKLAHDVYTKMYELYGVRVFGNILSSEQAHQSRVLTLLQARNVADPRSAELGVFRNQELQTLYNQLIAQGSKSVIQAYKAGIAIEEKDIADINAQLKTASDQDVILTLEGLRRGSENHLRAFSSQF